MKKYQQYRRGEREKEGVQSYYTKYNVHLTI